MILLLVFSTACEEFPPASELGADNQVLAVRATPPELAPGDTVTLDALVHWPAGTPTLFWLMCVPSEHDTALTCTANNMPESEAPPLCAADSTARVCIAGVGDTATYTVPQSAFANDGEQHTLYSYLLAAGSVEGLQECGDVLSGAAPSENCLYAFKRVVVSTRDNPNRNPIVTGLMVDEETVDATVAELITVGTDLDEYKVSLEVSLDATSIDEVVSDSEDPAQLTLQWFSNCGKITNDLQFVDVEVDDNGEFTHSTALTEWLPKQRGNCMVHAVVRDDFGGAGFFTQQFLIDPY